MKLGSWFNKNLQNNQMILQNINGSEPSINAKFLFMQAQISEL